jgi:hypothetical protein
MAAQSGTAPDPGAGSTTGASLLELFRRRAFLHVCLGSGLFTVMWLSLLGWLPSFFIRSHGLTVADAGLKLALVLGVSQMLGLFAGGLLGDRLSAADRRAYLWLCAAASALAAPLLAGALLVPGADAALTLLFPALLIGLMQGAPALASIQAVAGPHMRATAVAAYLVVVNVLAGLGAQLVGVLSELWRPQFGTSALGTALVAVIAVCGPWSALHFWLASRRILKDISPGEG